MSNGVCFMHAAAWWGLGGMPLQVNLDALRLLLRPFLVVITDSQPFWYSNHRFTGTQERESQAKHQQCISWYLSASNFGVYNPQVATLG